MVGVDDGVAASVAKGDGAGTRVGLGVEVGLGVAVEALVATSFWGGTFVGVAVEALVQDTRARERHIAAIGMAAGLIVPPLGVASLGGSSALHSL